MQTSRTIERRSQRGACAFFAVSWILAVGLFCPGRALANLTTVTYNFDNEFSGGTAPVSGIKPWITAVFRDTSTPGSVTLTLSAPHLTANEFVSGWYFNLNPILDPTHLQFNSATVSAGSLSLPSIHESVDTYKADGDGKYDILLSFSTSGGLSGNFTTGDTLTYTLTGNFGGHVLSAADFLFLSAPAGGHGPFDAAAHVQGIGPTGGASGWVDPSTPITGQDVTPAPEGGATAVLLGFGMLAVEGLRRKIRTFRG